MLWSDKIALAFQSPRAQKALSRLIIETAEAVNSARITNPHRWLVNTIWAKSDTHYDVVGENPASITYYFLKIIAGG